MTSYMVVAMQDKRKDFSFEVFFCIYIYIYIYD